MSDQPKFLADSEEAFFGPKPQTLAGSEEEFFGPRPEPGILSRITSFRLPDPGTLLGGELPRPGDPPRSIIAPIIDKTAEAWGARPVGLSPDVEKWMRGVGIFNDWETEDRSAVKALNEAAVRSAAVPIDAFIRGLTAGFVGAQETASQTIGGALGRDIAAIPEAFQGSPYVARDLGAPARPSPSAAADIADARDLGIIGQGEAGWRGAQAEALQRLDPTGRPSPTERVRVPVERALEPAPETTAVSEPTGPDIHATARRIAPQVFDEYDALATRRETFRDWLDELATQRDRRTSPEIAEIDNQIDALREQRLSAPRQERFELANRVTELETRRERLLDTLPEAGDTPEMARIRRSLQEADYRMRDLAPDVSAAYRRAESEGAPLVEQAPVEPPAAPAAPAVVPETGLPAVPPERAAPRTPQSTLAAGGIVDDVRQQLVKAGRSEQEAAAAAQIVAAYYETRAKRFAGKLGTPEELYAAEGAQIRGAEAGGRRGAASGKTRITDGRTVITLFRRADASTFMHETGHQWLEQLKRDAANELAPPDLKADMQTVRAYLGVDETGEIPTRAHEKFARSFERYLMEGTAPSAGLARVFQQFKEWLTAIYQRVTALRAPINDDIRGVFDRMLAAPDERPVIAPERERGRTFADLHEADLETTPPENAIRVADTLRDERARLAGDLPPGVDIGRRDIQPGRGNRDTEPGGRAPDSSGDAGRPGPEPAGAGAQYGAVGEGGIAVAPQRAGVVADAERTAGGTTTPPEAPNARFERAPETGVMDKAGNIRLELLNTPEDVNVVLRQTAAENSEFLTERRGVLPDRVVADLADALGMDAARINRRKIGEAFNAEEVVAARKLLIQSATSVRDAMRKAATGSDADVLAYAQSKARHAMIQGQVSGITAEAGRALRAFRALEGSAEAQQLGEFLQQSTGRDLFQLRQEAQLGMALETPKQISKFVRDSSKATWTQKAVELWTNSLLSGWRTHAVNIQSNALFALYASPETAAAAAVGRIRTLLPGAAPERVLAGEAAERLYGIWQGAPEGVRSAWELLKNDDLTDLNNKMERGRFRAIEGRTGDIVRIPGRLLGAEDKFFKAIAFRQEMNAQAYRQATREGLSGDKRAARMAQLLDDPPEWMTDAALRNADYQTFNSNLGTLGNLLLKTAADYPAVRFVIPFIRTPLNILKRAAERTPLGLFMREVRDDIMGKNGPIAQDTAIGRMAMGTSLGVATAYLASQMLITDGGPTDPDERAAMMRTGRQPYSFRVGEMYYAFNRLEPLGMIMGIAADAYAVSSKASETEMSDIAEMILASISKNLTSKTWLKGPSDLIQAVTDPDRYGENYIKSLAGTIVPTFIAQAASETDPYIRQARTVIDAIKNRIPGVSQTLLPKRDIWGEPIERTDFVGPAGFTGIAQSQEQDDPVNQAMLKAGVFPAPLDRKIRGVELTDEQYDEFSRIAGRMAKIRVGATIGVSGFDMMPDELKRQQFRDMITEERERARGIMLAKYPDILRQAIEIKRDHLFGVKRQQ